MLLVRWTAVVVALIFMCGCSAHKKTAPALYCRYKINGILKEIRISPERQFASFYPVYTSQSCAAPDSVLMGSGCSYQLLDPGGRIAESVAFYFYHTEAKNQLNRIQDWYYYSEHKQISNLLIPRQWNYIYELSCPKAPCAGLTYYDSAGTLWRSYKTTQNVTPSQANAVFKITGSKTIQHPEYRAAELIEGIFSCKVYSPEGDSLLLSDGAFTGLINNINF